MELRLSASTAGGTLNSVLLAAGVVDEVSVLIHLFLAGDRPESTMFDPGKAGFPDLQIPLTHIKTEMVGFLTFRRRDSSI